MTVEAGVPVIGEDTWLQTSSGKRVNVLAPSPDQINIKDIAHSLSLLCRFNGHCSSFYSVAQHSILGTHIALKVKKDKELAKQFLLHDATEAFVGDMIRPVKHHIPMFKELESNLWVAISEKFNFTEVLSEVKKLDNIMITWEKRDIMPNSEFWPNLPDITPYNFPLLKGWTWQRAEREYMKMYWKLFIA